MIADSDWQTVTVTNLTYSVYTAGVLNYLSCYYHINVDANTWKMAFIEVFINQAGGVIFYILGGNSRTNASLSVNGN